MPAFSLKNFLRLIGLVYFIVLGYSIFNFKSRILFSYPEYMFDIPVSRKCMLERSSLKEYVSVNLSKRMNTEEIEAANTDVEIGGKWEPKDCEPWQRVAIIVPYRDRAYHLRLFLNRMHQMLKRQKIAYQIIVSEQAGNDLFIKGRIYNIAYLEAMKMQNFDCFIFHVSVVSVQ